MRRLLWLLFFFAAYLWVSLTGNEEMLIQRGRVLYRIIVHWFEDAEIDFHLDEKRPSKDKGRSKRWN